MIHKIVKRSPSIKRWLHIILIAAPGSIVIAILWPLAATALLGTIDDWFGVQKPFVVTVWIFVITFFVLLIFHNFIGTKLHHFSYFLRYPPYPIAIIISLLGASLWPVIKTGKLTALSETFVSYGQLGFIYSSMWLCHVIIFRAYAKISTQENISSVASPSNYDSSDFSKFKEWLADDVPLNNIQDDMFNHRLIAETVYNQLRIQNTTIALQGEYGAGKSSICRMVESLSVENKQPFIFVEVSCWGFEEPMRVQEVILEHVLDEVSDEVDCLNLRSMPSGYLQAMNGYSGLIDSILTLATSRKSPIEQLNRLSPVLKAIGKRVVIIIEDLDRNGEHFDLSPIQSLLIQLRQVKEIQFILAISPEQQIDFLKVCDHVESIPTLPRSRVLSIVASARDTLLKTNPHGIQLDKLDDIFSEERELRLGDQSVHYYWPRDKCIYSLLNRPRILKSCLQRLFKVWPRVAGEVRIDDLINITVLRIAAPEAWRFFQQNWHLFGAAKNNTHSSNSFDEKKSKQLQEKLQRQWKKLIEESNFDARSAAELIQDIYPLARSIFKNNGSHSVKYQSMYSEQRAGVYANRLFNETLSNDDTSDQTILDLLQNAKTDTSKLQDLAELITDSEEASDAFEHLSAGIRFDSDLALLGEVYSVIRSRHGVKAEVRNIPGFLAPWRNYKDNKPKNINDWLIPELKKCIPQNLPLAVKIYYYWLGGERTSLAERKPARKIIIGQLKKYWNNMSPESIIQGFDPSFPYTLFHLIFTSEYTQPDKVPYCSVKNWSWLKDILWLCCEESPSKFLPQVIIAIQKHTSGSYPPSKYQFNHDAIDVWFGKNKDELIKLIANGYIWDKGMSAQGLYVLNQAVSESKEYLSSTTK